VDALYYELVHNLVLELTRVGIEHRNVKMRLESLSSRMDFDERRARALEGVVQYRPDTGPAREVTASQPQARPASQPTPAQQVRVQDAHAQPGSSPDDQAAESSTTRRRRRRRRGRRGGRGRTPGDITAPAPIETLSPEDSATPPHGDPTAGAALEANGGEGDFDADSGEDEGPDPSAQ
jgi:hypothetical protein